MNRARQLWLACVAARSVFETKYRLRRADGNYRWTAVKGIPILAEDGTIREWIGANTDIHDTIATELELAQRLEREKRNSALLAKVAQASRTLHTVLAADDIAQALVTAVRDILQTHQAVVSLTEAGGWTQAINAVSLSDKYAAYRGYDARTDGSGIYAQVCRDNRVMRLTQAQLEAHPAWRGFGEHAGAHPVLRGWLAVPLIDRMGSNIGLIQASDRFEGDFTDEDEAILVQLASIAATGFENARLYGSLQEQDRRKDEFLAMLAHELRNPLAPIAAAAEMLKFGTANEERVRRSSEVISRQVRHMTSLVDDLLDVSRVTRGLIKLDRALLDPMQLVANAVEQSQPLITARGHALSVTGDAAGARIAGDAHRLVQVLANLLNNAAKYTPHGGRIDVTVARAGRHGARSPCATMVSASTRCCCRTCSTCSPRPNARRTAPRAAWASGWRWCGPSSTCMAATSSPPATAPGAAAPSRSASALPMQSPGANPSCSRINLSRGIRNTSSREYPNN